MITVRNETDLLLTHGIVDYEQRLDIYGTDGVKFVINPDNGKIYRALKPKASMAGANLTDDNFWVPTDTIYNLASLSKSISVLKEGIKLQPVAGQKQLKVGAGKLHIYSSDKQGFDVFTQTAEVSPIQFKYLYADGTEVDGTLTDTLVTDKYESPANNLASVLLGRRATYQKVYVDKDFNYYIVLGDTKYSSMTVAQKKYSFESIPNIDDLFFIGGILIRKDATDTSNTDKCVFIYSSKLAEGLIGSDGSTTLLFLDPVNDTTALKAVSAPTNGETRQDLSTLPDVTFYTFNTGATTGIAPDDGTSGFWNILKAQGELKTVTINSDSNIEPNNYYVTDTGSGVVTLTMPGGVEVDKEVGIKNINGANAVKFKVDNGSVEGLTEFTINGDNSSYIFKHIGNNNWVVKNNYSDSTVFESYNAKDTDGNDLQFADNSLTKQLPLCDGEVVLKLKGITGKKLKSIANGSGWYIIDPYTFTVALTPDNADTTVTFELEDVKYDFGRVGEIVAIEPNPDFGIYALDGTTTPPDKLLADKIRANPSKYVGFTVNSDDTIDTPNWKGDILYAGGARGLDSKFGTQVNQALLRHNHKAYKASSTDTVSGAGYVIEGWDAGGDKYTGNSGGDYNRVYGRTIESWCIIGTTILKLDDTAKLATAVTATFNGLTVNGGDTTGIVYEGVGAYRFKADLSSGKMLDKASIDNANVTVVDAYNGIILVQQAKGGGDFTINLTDKDVDYTFVRSLNPLGIGNVQLAIKQSGSAMIDSALLSTLRFWDNTDNQPAVTAHSGVDGNCVFLRSDKKINTPVIDLNKRSFLISGWYKLESLGNTSKYVMGRSGSQGNNKTLHIGWRDDDTCTVAFYADDINANVTAPYRFQDIKRKWVHLVIWHDTNTKVSKMFINGNKILEGTHNGQYQGGIDFFNGARNNADVKGFLSEFRLYRTAQNQSFTGVDDNTAQAFFDNENPFLGD